MSAQKVDVLDALKRQIEHTKQFGGSPSFQTMQQVHDAVSEIAEKSARYDWIVSEPEGAQHLLNLLKQGKGGVEDFGRMIDRISASKAKALARIGGDV